MKIAPRGTWIVGTQIEAPDTYGGSLVMTDTMKEKIRERCVIEVLAVGPDVPATTGIVRGARVIYDRDQRIVIGGLDAKVYIQVKAEHVCGVVESDEMASPEEIEAERKKIEGALNERRAAAAKPKLEIARP